MTDVSALIAEAREVAANNRARDPMDALPELTESLADALEAAVAAIKDAPHSRFCADERSKIAMPGRCGCWKSRALSVSATEGGDG